MPDEGDDLTPVEGYLDAIAQDGLWEVHAAVYDLDLNTLRRDPTFLRAEKQSMSKFAALLGKHAVDMAINGVQEDVVHQGQVTGTRRKHDSALFLRVLETYLPGFKSERKTTVTHKTELDADNIDVTQLSVEEREEIIRRLENTDG
jgi:hypothetical protein